MAKRLILTFIADDRPGLVERLAQSVADAGGNWLDSRMAHLAAKFAGIAEIEIEDDGIAGLQAQLDDLSSDGFHLVVEEAGDDAAPDGAVFEIETVLESTGAPASLPSLGVTVQKTVWSRSKSPLSSVAFVTPGSAPSTDQP